MTTDRLPALSARDPDGIPLARRLNLWLGKFTSDHSKRAYADDLGIPHEIREWTRARTADPDGAPAAGRRGRRRTQFRRELAFFPWCQRGALNPLGGVGLEQLQRWLVALRDAGLAKKTRDRMLTSVSEFYVAMQRQGLPVGNPAALVDRRTAGLTGHDDDDDRLFLEVDQVRQLLISARRGSGRGRDLYRERDLVTLEILAVTGARASEVTQLDLLDYRRPAPGSKAELVLHGKGGKVRVASLDPHVADDIDDWLQIRAERFGHRLPTVHGQVAAGRQPLLATRTGGRLAPTYLGVIMTKVASREDCPLRGIAHELHPHALRAAFITAALDAGVPIEQVAAAVGHKHIETTLRYDRRRRRRATRAFAVVSGLLTEDTAAPTDPSEVVPPGSGAAAIEHTELELAAAAEHLATVLGATDTDAIEEDR